MRVFRLAAAVLFLAAAAFPATFGTVVPIVGGAADIVLDEPRGRLYLVNTAQTRVEVYSIAQRRVLSTIRTDSLPLSAALSQDGQFLFVAAHDANALNVISLETLTITSRVSLPAKPEGIAVGGDGRVLISTIGTGAGNASNTLLIWDPSATTTVSLAAVPLAPPPPLSPLLPAPSGRVFLTNRSQLVPTWDGRYIIGVNIPNANSRAVFVYEVASGTVLRSRTVTNASSVISVAPDGSKFMVGLTLFETETLQILAQQNAANAPYPFPNGANFNTQQNQGGSVFSPDGTMLFSAFNIAPVNTSRANVSQLMINDPDNLLIRTALQITENLAGKMVITNDGTSIFALSESGFVVLPMSTVEQNPLAVPASTVSLLTNDQCGVYGDSRSAAIEVRNAGRGRLTVTAQVLQTTPAGAGGLGGVGGPGGGQVGGGVVITLPNAPGGILIPAPPTLPGGFPTTQNPSVAATAPTIRTSATADGGRLDVSFTSAASARNPGTVSPTHTVLLSSDQAINIPSAVRVFQNFRDSESRGDIVPVEVGLSANEGLVDMVLDNVRQRLYIANSGKNRVEVYDIRRRQLLPPVKVGQLPRSLALSPDGSTLYVANSGGENISILDPDSLRVTGKVKFPPLPFNSGAAIMTPSVLAATQRGLVIVMNNGTLWRLVGEEAIPRAISPVSGSNTVAAPRTVAATPGGEYAILLAGNGFVYLYDALADEFVQGRQVFNNPIQGFYGPVSAGPRGQYYVTNGLILNSALTPVGQTTGGLPSRPVAAVAAASGMQFVRFTQPVRQNANQVATDAGTVELVDAGTGLPLRSAPALEGPISTQVGTTRVNVDGRMIAIDGTGSTAFALTASGLSILPLETTALADRPLVNTGGAVNLTSYTTSFAPGSLMSVFGRNLAIDGVYAGGTAPAVMGGLCITLNNQPLPLLMTSQGQVNAQIPPELAAGRYNMVLRNIERKAASLPQSVTLVRYAPAIFTNTETKEALVFRPNGTLVTKANPARRDEPLMLFATGLGATKGGRVVSAQPSPANPLAEVSEDVQLYFGDPRYSQSEMIVDWVGLTPGIIGVYQVNLRVPGNRMRGEELPVTLRIGGVGSQSTGPVVPTIAVE